MAKTYRVGPRARMTNLPFKVMTRLGLGARYRHLLTVRGRRTGELHTVPVDVMQVGDHRWLVAPYGVVGWVHNARASREATLSRGRRRERVTLDEVGALESVPVLRAYHRDVEVARPYFDVTTGSSAGEFAVEAARHPVFRVERAHANREQPSTVG
jgi:hypothetical protein